MARRLLHLLAMTGVLVVAAPTVALACGGIVAPGNSGVLRRATTLAAWVDGYEHYVTGFEFASGADRFGYIVPLPAEPTKIEKGGEWTLERLLLEVTPPIPAPEALGAADSARSSVEVLQKVRVDSLDITVVRGGGSDVAEWARENGFVLTDDAPEVLEHYSEAGAVFALAKFDVKAASKQGLVEGQGTVIHFTIPTPGPWIPLHILSLGKAAGEPVEADLFLLTERRPSVAPALWDMPGVTLSTSEPASASLLADLGDDRGMGWMPDSGMWLTAFKMSTPAELVTTDLAIEGGGPPQAVPTSAPVRVPGPPAAWPWVIGGVGFVALVLAGVAAGLPRPRAQAA